MDFGLFEIIFALFIYLFFRKKISYLDILFSPFKLFNLKFECGNSTDIRKFKLDVQDINYKKIDDCKFKLIQTPRLVLILFKKYYSIIINTKNDSTYWELYLLYKNCTNKSLSKKERVNIIRNNFSEDLISKVIKSKYLD